VARGFVANADGNVVTGDGTSTATCPNSENAIGEGYQVVSS